MHEDSHPFAEEECAMKRGGMWSLLAMLLWLGSGWAGAEETAQTTPGAAPATPAGDVRRADPVVVTATRSEQPLEQTGASVTVVPEEEMRVHEYRAVDEVLRTVPGVQVGTSGSPGKLSTIRIRGANPTQVQVLVDGVRVKSLTSGDFDHGQQEFSPDGSRIAFIAARHANRDDDLIRNIFELDLTHPDAPLRELTSTDDRLSIDALAYTADGGLYFLASENMYFVALTWQLEDELQPL